MKKSDKHLLMHDQVLGETLKKSGYDEHDIEEFKKAWEHTKTLIPRGFDKLNSSDDCFFCKGTIKEKATSFAEISLAHEEPKTLKRGLFGLGKKNVVSRIGSLIPAYVAICTRCKRTLRLVELQKWFGLAIGGLIGFGIIAYLSNSSLGDNISQVVPYAVFVGSLILGYLAGKLSAVLYIKRKSKDVHLSVFDVEILKEMKEKGWFILQDDKEGTSLNFSKTPGKFGKIFED